MKDEKKKNSYEEALIIRRQLLLEEGVVFFLSVSSYVTQKMQSLALGRELLSPKIKIVNKYAQLWKYKVLYQKSIRNLTAEEVKQREGRQSFCNSVQPKMRKLSPSVVNKFQKLLPNSTNIRLKPRLPSCLHSDVHDLELHWTCHGNSYEKSNTEDLFIQRKSPKHSPTLTQNINSDELTELKQSLEMVRKKSQYYMSQKNRLRYLEDIQKELLNWLLLNKCSEETNQDMISSVQEELIQIQDETGQIHQHLSHTKSKLLKLRSTLNKLQGYLRLF
ncbi:uncharacterized protein LOC111088993 [Limulus polyphemus]|uniref:Uncharacterized protein LOC111088993 n=1 Tax=Limulus polyphemus TaxID=6850 RepID=A0ABM1TK18_LIMPO|nr:uncharacterized protein LOC111088993 [Limulus polyphemus]